MSHLLHAIYRFSFVQACAMLVPVGGSVAFGADDASIGGW